MRELQFNDSKNNDCMTVEEVIFANADRLASKTALVAGGKVVTYSQLRKLIIGAVDYLSKNGVKPGDKVIIKALPSVSFVTALFGVSFCGAIAVPLEKNMPEEGVKDVAERLDVRFSIVNQRSEGLSDCADSPDMKEGNPTEFLLLDDLLAYAEELAEAGKADDYEVSFPNIDATSIIMFTTGTTGNSKGVTLRYRNTLAAMQNTMGTTGMCESDVNVIPAPLNHTFGFRRTMGSLYSGGTVVLLNGVTSARLFFKALDEHGGTTLTLVPSAMEYILKVSGEMLAKYKDQIRSIEVGAEPVPNDLKEKLLKLLPKTNICNTYGSSEAGCVVGINYREWPDKLDSIGREAVNAEIFFTDENHKPMKADSSKNAGFIAIRGPMVMECYHGDPALTGKVIGEASPNERILYTNDIAYKDEDGFIFLLGRKGDVINVGGNKVSPIEVEQTANSCPMVRECACVPCKDPNGILTQVPKLFVVTEEGHEFCESKLKSYLTSKLEQYKVPLVYEIIDELPRTYNSKIQRNKLR